MLHIYHQVAQSDDYRPSNVPRAERTFYLFDRLVRLSKVCLRSRKIESSKGLSGWLAALR